MRAGKMDIDNIMTHKTPHDRTGETKHTAAYRDISPNSISSEV